MFQGLRNRAKTTLLFAFILLLLTSLAPPISVQAYIEPNELSESEQVDRAYLYALIAMLEDSDYPARVSAKNINEYFIHVGCRNISIGHEIVPDGGTVDCKNADMYNRGLGHVNQTWSDLVDAIFTRSNNNNYIFRGREYLDPYVDFLKRRAADTDYNATSVVGPAEYERRMLITLGECVVSLAPQQVAEREEIIIEGERYDWKAKDNFQQDIDGNSTISVGHDISPDGRLTCREIVQIVEDNDWLLDDGSGPVNNPATFIGQAEPTCESLNPGLGWMLCPVLQGALNVMDGFIGFFVNILHVEFASEQQKVLESVWIGFRQIANVAFAVVFLVVIYSAATGGVMSAYDVKRLLPRLFISAIAVQLSLVGSIWIINVFNDIGQGAGDLIVAPLGTGNSFLISPGDNPLGGGEKTLTGLVGETALSIFIIVLLILAVFFSISGLLIMTVVFLLRNIGVVVLAVISPIALVAWVLPTTEPFFKKWWKFFIQLLMLYPIATMFMASGKLVGAIWLGTAGGASTGLNKGNVAGTIVGTLAIFAPYFLAPKMFSFAGSAVGSLNGAVTNAKKAVREREGFQRTAAKAKAGELTRGNNMLTSGLNRAAGVATNPRTVFGTKAGRERAKFRAEGVYQKMNEEEKRGAARLLERETSTMGDDQRKKHLRDIAGSDKQSEGARQAALEMMLATNDIDGLSDIHSKAQKNAKSGNYKSAQVFGRFTGANGSTLSGKAKHLVHPHGARGVAGSDASSLAGQHDQTIKKTIKDLQDLHAAGDATARDELVQMLNTYTNDIANDPTLHNKLGTKTRDRYGDLGTWLTGHP